MERSTVEILDPGADRAPDGPPAGVAGPSSHAATVALVALVALAASVVALAGGGGAPPPAPTPDPDVPGVTAVDLGALPVPVALTAHDGGRRADVWVLGDGTARWLPAVRPDGDPLEWGHLGWWGSGLAYVADGRLWATGPDPGHPPRAASAAVSMLPSSGGSSAWAVLSRPDPAAVVLRLDAGTAEVARLQVGYGSWAGVGAGDRFLYPDGASSWWIAEPGGAAHPVEAGVGMHQAAVRGDLVFFTPREGSEVVVGRLPDTGGAGGGVIARHDVSALHPRHHAMVGACPSPDGALYALDLGHSVAVLRSAAPEAAVVGLVRLARPEPLAWAGPHRLLGVPAPTHPGADAPPPLDLALIDPSGEVAPHVVARLDEATWLAATPGGSC